VGPFFFVEKSVLGFGGSGVDVLAKPESYAYLGPNTRAHVVSYDFLTPCCLV